MNGSMLPAVLAMVVAGAMVAAQAPVNGALARVLDDSVLTACVSFGVGFAALSLISLVRGAWPAAGALAIAPWWAWVGGLLGAFYVAVAAWAVPKLGVVTLTAAVVFGQLVAALIFDATGAFGVAVQAISWGRLTAVGLVLAGLVLSRTT